MIFSADDIGEIDLLVMTIDALRFDVAEQAMQTGRTPFLQSLLSNAWEARHAPGSFTFSSHAALFACFWPTPAFPGQHRRPFALRFHGSRSIDAATCLLDGENLVQGLRGHGYHTICIGGVGFFNRLNPLGSVFPNMFDESHWEPQFGVAELHSTRRQIHRTVAILRNRSTAQPIFLFMNLSATHPPTHMYLPGARLDSIDSQIAALEYVDRQLQPLFEALGKRGRGGAGFLMSDHGTLFGEEGFTGHRVAHPAVWTVPYGECSWRMTV